ncbi:Arginine permease [Lachnellula subtilissima]|uniref:Arginine permease n=1 Tax=Lachnellula subtilissima TaxID=602034 RepID=A0A8H8U9D0_9HELO|nr:Arginine permease [Lachnellula subtilissima]
MGSDDVIASAPVEEKSVNGGTQSCGASGHSGDDVEKKGASDFPQLQRRLKSRHLQMIAIGGTIGTGLFIGSGEALSKAGPAGALIAYIFVGTIVYSVIQSLGEMATYIPIAGAFTSYATRFVDPSLGFSMGWIYWFSWAMTYALELTATGLIIQYWNKDLSIGIFIGVFWVAVTLANFLPVSFYGEFEFWFASIKIVTIVGFLIFAICIDAGAGQHGYLGFHTWGNPGAFAPYLITDNEALAKFVGFWAVLIQAGFSYQGTELVGIAAGETENPRKTVPAAIKKTFYRILFFFVFSIFFIGLLVPYDNPDLLSAASDATASPFVIAAKLAGVKVLPGLINAVLLFVVLSAANANVYSGSRILVALARDGAAPAILGRTAENGVPYVAVIFTAVFGLLAFLNLSHSGGTVFNWLQNITAVAGFITWACINGCHIAFMRALAVRKISRDSLPYKSMWQPFFAWYGLFFNVLIIITQGFESFIPWNTVILFVVAYVGHKVVMRTKFVSSVEADIDTGCLIHETTTWSIEEPTTMWGKFWAWLS